MVIRIHINPNIKEGKSYKYEKSDFFHTRPCTSIKHIHRRCIRSEAAPTLQKEPIQLSGNGTDREPNNWFDEASEILAGVDIYGEIGKHLDGGYAGYYDTSDYYKFKAFQSGWYQFNIQGDIYPNTWLRLGLADSNGSFIRYAEDRQYSLGKNLEAGKWYYLVVETPGAEQGQLFDYKITSTIK